MRTIGGDGKSESHSGGGKDAHGHLPFSTDVDDAAPIGDGDSECDDRKRNGPEQDFGDADLFFIGSVRITR
jgi:hypothetical protein